MSESFFMNLKHDNFKKKNSLQENSNNNPLVKKFEENQTIYRQLSKKITNKNSPYSNFKLNNHYLDNIFPRKKNIIITKKLKDALIKIINMIENKRQNKITEHIKILEFLSNERKKHSIRNLQKYKRMGNKTQTSISSTNDNIENNEKKIKNEIKKPTISYLKLNYRNSERSSMINKNNTANNFIKNSDDANYLNNTPKIDKLNYNLNNSKTKNVIKKAYTMIFNKTKTIPENDDNKKRPLNLNRNKKFKKFFTKNLDDNKYITYFKRSGHQNFNNVFHNNNFDNLNNYNSYDLYKKSIYNFNNKITPLNSQDCSKNYTKNEIFIENNIDTIPSPPKNYILRKKSINKFHNCLSKPNTSNYKTLITEKNISLAKLKNHHFTKIDKNMTPKNASVSPKHIQYNNIKNIFINNNVLENENPKNYIYSNNINDNSFNNNRNENLFSNFQNENRQNIFLNKNLNNKEGDLMYNNSTNKIININNNSPNVNVLSMNNSSINICLDKKGNYDLFPKIITFNYNDNNTINATNTNSSLKQLTKKHYPVIVRRKRILSSNKQRQDSLSSKNSYNNPFLNENCIESEIIQFNNNKNMHKINSYVNFNINKNKLFADNLQNFNGNSNENPRYFIKDIFFTPKMKNNSNTNITNTKNKNINSNGNSPKNYFYSQIENITKKIYQKPSQINSKSKLKTKRIESEERQNTYNFFDNNSKNLKNQRKVNNLIYSPASYYNSGSNYGTFGTISTVEKESASNKLDSIKMDFSFRTNSTKKKKLSLMPKNKRCYMEKIIYYIKQMPIMKQCYFGKKYINLFKNNENIQKLKNNLEKKNKIIFCIFKNKKLNHSLNIRISKNSIDKFEFERHSKYMHRYSCDYAKNEEIIIDKARRNFMLLKIQNKIHNRRKNKGTNDKGKNINTGLSILNNILTNKKTNDKTENLIIGTNKLNDIFIKKNNDINKNEVTLLLNKLTINNYENILNELSNLIFYTNDKNIIYSFVEIILSKASSEKLYSRLYAKICKDIYEQNILKEDENLCSMIQKECSKRFNQNYENENIIEMKFQFLGLINFIYDLLIVGIINYSKLLEFLEILYAKYVKQENNFDLKFLYLEGIIDLLNYLEQANNNENKNRKLWHTLNDFLNNRFKNFVMEKNNNFTFNNIENSRYINMPNYLKYKIINLFYKHYNGCQESLYEKYFNKKKNFEINKEYNDEMSLDDEFNENKSSEKKDQIKKGHEISKSPKIKKNLSSRNNNNNNNKFNTIDNTNTNKKNRSKKSVSISLSKKIPKTNLSNNINENLIKNILSEETIFKKIDIDLNNYFVFLRNEKIFYETQINNYINNLYDWSITDDLIKNHDVELIDVIRGYIEISKISVNEINKVFMANGYIKTIIEYYINDLSQNQKYLLHLNVIKIYLDINNLIKANEFMYEIMGKLLYILLINKIYFMKDLNVFLRQSEETIVNVSKVVKFAIISSGNLAKKYHNDFKNTKLFASYQEMFTRYITEVLKNEYGLDI